jgi:hypothetical protein
MIHKPFSLIFILSSLQPCAQDTDSVHPWTSSDGKIIEAKFVRTEEQAVVIERDGKPFAIPFAKLAPASVELAKRLKENATEAAATTDDTTGHVDAATVTNKLHQIIVPKIEFQNTPVREAIDFLHQSSIELDTLEADPGRKGVKFVFNKSTAPDKFDALRISDYRIRNVPLNIALNHVCVHTSLCYVIEGSQVTLIPKEEYETKIYCRTFTVSPDFSLRLAAYSGDRAARESRKSVMQHLGACGVAFAEGASADFSGNQLVVCNTLKELDKIEKIVGGLAAQAAADPTIRFRWLQTDPKTADAIVDTLKANTMEADAFSAKIDPQIRSGKITEVASFDRKIISGERFLLRPVAANLPLVMEAEAAVSHDGLLMDLRCVPEWTPKTTRGTGLLRSSTALTICRQHWSLFARWGDGKADTLLLACGGSTPTQPAEQSTKGPINGTPITVHLDAEWRETSAEDLAKLAQAPPESRAKALAWLRGRSTLLANATGSCRSRQKSAHEHLWGGNSDVELKEESNKRGNREAKEPPPRPGVIFEWEPTLMGEGERSTAMQKTEAEKNQEILNQELNLRLRATYVPLNAKTKSQEMNYEFQGTLRSGVPEFVAAIPATGQNHPVVVLILNPWYEIIR